MSTLDTGTTSEAARTYARALHDATLAATLQQLRTLTGQLRGGDAAALVARIDEVLGQAASPTLRNFLLAMAGENDLDLLPQVVEAFSAYSQLPAQQFEGEVTSAEELTPEQQQRISQDLLGRYGEGLTLRFTVDPSLIGGLIIRVGDRVVDNSLRTRLSALQRSMLAS